ncbi:MAG: hypothetical protein GY778_01425 [bacterium]|nr:hypothetical protein [bacterium]
MRHRRYGKRGFGLALWILSMAGASCGAPGGTTAGGGGGADQIDDAGTDGGEDLVPEFIARNDGGGDLATRMGGATFSGDAVGPLESGSLTLIFDAEGVLLSVAGTLLADFFGFPAGSEVTFDYQTESVTGTYVDPETGPVELQTYLATNELSLEMRQIIVTLTGDTFSARTVYVARLPGQAPGEQAATVEATLRFGSNDVLQGALDLPAHLDRDLPVFILERL